MLLTIVLPLVALGILATGLLSHTILRRLRRASRELWEREAQARHEAKHDALSGLPNRVHMVKESTVSCKVAPKRANEIVPSLRTSISIVSRTSTTRSAIKAGDELIKLVAQRLKDCLRSKDFLARFGGDEFVILCAPAGPRPDLRSRNAWLEPLRRRLPSMARIFE